MIGGFQMQQKQMRPDCGASTRCIRGESEIHELWCNCEAFLNWVDVLFRCAEVVLELCCLECWRCPAIAVAASSAEKAAQLTNEDVRLSHANRLLDETFCEATARCFQHARRCHREYLTEPEMSICPAFSELSGPMAFACAAYSVALWQLIHSEEDVESWLQRTRKDGCGA